MTGTDRPMSPLAVLVPDRGTVRAVVERSYRAGREEMWTALTRPERLCGWLGVLTGEMAPGGTYRLAFGDGDDEVVTGTVLTCEPPARLVVTWVLPDGHETEVEVALEEDADGTTLRLEHRGLPGESAHGYAAGWHVHLDDLRSMLAGAEPAGTWAERFAELLPAYRNASTSSGTASRSTS
ncbi:uncharacterized protein YndB with AHSA1/START domain [Georgenia soli]|uniref:Uncharacterized protein YndB with AHSA1/START domain n=1 Tax=Georgenia soli TaxID=638953 RepID=A0A2A9EJH0_9MICO|nr:SRPBCC family protein [Georgenia soli]PFG38390.1 uncharacterized protein YndB with AHSA1/START domain [Georgenia soli]